MCPRSASQYEYEVSNTFNITNLVPFAGVADSDDEESADLRTNPLQEGEYDAILPRRGPITRVMARRLQEDWAKDAGDDPRILMSHRLSMSPLIFVHIILGFQYFLGLVFRAP